VKLIATATVILTIVLTGCGSPIDSTTPPNPAFYEAPAASDPIPGVLLRAEPLGVNVPGAKSYRILYETANSHGKPRPCGGILFIPTTAAPSNGRLVIAWAHPVIGDNVAPSRSATPLEGTNPWLEEMIARGWIVVGSDYAGVGTGSQEWLNGQAEARDLAYSVESVKAFAGSGASNEWVAWGISYGGHAALWSGSLGATLLPTFHLLGIAAAAPVAELVALEDAYGLPWAANLRAETPPPPMASIPAIIAQGTRDEVVFPATTALLEAQWCAATVRVESVWMRGVDHEGSGAAAASAVVDWIGARLQHRPVPNNCGTMAPIRPSQP